LSKVTAESDSDWRMQRKIYIDVLLSQFWDLCCWSIHSWLLSLLCISLLLSLNRWIAWISFHLVLYTHPTVVADSVSYHLLIISYTEGSTCLYTVENTNRFRVCFYFLWSSCNFVEFVFTQITGFFSLFVLFESFKNAICHCYCILHLFLCIILKFMTIVLLVMLGICCFASMVYLLAHLLIAIGLHCLTCTQNLAPQCMASRCLRLTLPPFAHYYFWFQNGTVFFSDLNVDVLK